MGPAPVVVRVPTHPWLETGHPTHVGRDTTRGEEDPDTSSGLPRHGVVDIQPLG